MFAFQSLAASLAAAVSMQQAPAAAPLPVGTLCAQDDIAGVWKSDLLGRSADGQTAPPVLGTDYMRFGADGTMVYFGQTRALTELSEIEQGLETVEQAAGLHFKATIIAPGVLIVARDGVPVEGFTCTVIRNTGETGEIIWSQLRGRPPVLRHNIRLRR